MSRAGVLGPFFVSIGTPAQLARFLELNPTVPPERTFVDPSPSQRSYAALNLRPDFAAGEGVRLRPPANVDWAAYLGSVLELSPKPELEGEFPEGVKKQGGTFVLQGDERVIFASADRLPGDEPSVNEVLRVIGA
mmetsp:Transcript_393/g.1193  ORF Transcript_393/g.1193 Transcript_393/m.1193 type:complete len:135 (+) Transcript_393:230-634(+)